VDKQHHDSRRAWDECKRVKVAHTRLPSVGFRSWSRFLAVNLQVMWVIHPTVGCHCFPPGPQLPSQHLRAATNFAAWWTEAQWLPSVLWRCWLGGRKGIRPVKTEWLRAGMVMCLQRGADLHMAQLMPLPLTVSCFSTFLVPAHLGSPGKRAVKRVDR